MSQETINLLVGALIGFLSSLLTQTVSNIFQRKNDERKRKWDLEDKEINRKINSRDDKLQEAQAYLEAYKEALLQLLHLETRLIIYNPNKIEASVTEISEGFDNLRNLLNFSFKRLFSIEFLNDSELRELDKKLRKIFNNEMEYAFDLRMKFLRNTELDKETVEHRKIQFNSEISKILGDMQRRLEFISQNTLAR